MSQRAATTLFLLLIFLLIPSTLAQSSTSVDVAAYQLGLVAETTPGANLTYTITVTNYGPEAVDSFYIVDGWTVNEQGISAFAAPIAQPDFGDFTLVGTWQQNREDQEVLAWLLEGELAAGATIQFDWIVQVDSAYEGVLVNWVSIDTERELDGVWQARSETPLAAPPPIASAVDSNLENNRTTDGVTVVTTTPAGEGMDLALYQTGILTEVPASQPLESTWLVANLGPQPVQQFYLMAGWSLNSDGSSILAQPVTDPDFGEFKVVGRWRQFRQDEELWLWLLEGELLPGDSVPFQWQRTIVPAYRGDLVNWAGILSQNVPQGEWMAREGTTILPGEIENLPDMLPENNRSDDALTTITE